MTPLRPSTCAPRRSSSPRTSPTRAPVGTPRNPGPHPRWRPDVVVRDEADLGSAIAAEVLGIPTATVLVLAAGTLIRPDLVSAPLATLRAEHGLPPDPGLAMLTRGLVLSPFPRRSAARPRRCRCPRQRSRSGRRPGPRHPAARRGTRVYVDARDRLQLRLGRPLRAPPRRPGRRRCRCPGDGRARDIDPAAFGVQPGHVRIERFVPQAEVLRDTDLVVSHGGSGSLMATLAHGLPSVLLPLGADQPHNALRAEELGLARTLDAATVTPETIRRDRGATPCDDRGITARAARRIADEIDATPRRRRRPCRCSRHSTRQRARRANRNIHRLPLGTVACSAFSSGGSAAGRDLWPSSWPCSPPRPVLPLVAPWPGVEPDDHRLRRRAVAAAPWSRAGPAGWSPGSTPPRSPAAGRRRRPGTPGACARSRRSTR